MLALVGPAPEHPGGGGLAGDEAGGALGQGGLVEGLAERLGGYAGGGGGGLGLALKALLAGHGLYCKKTQKEESSGVKNSYKKYIIIFTTRYKNNRTEVSCNQAIVLYLSHLFISINLVP